MRRSKRLLVTQNSMEDLFVSERIDIEFSLKFQTVVADHISGYFATVHRNQLHSVADIIQPDDITWMLTIVMEAAVNDKHIDLGSGCHYTDAIHNSKMSIRKIEELDVNEWWTDPIRKCWSEMGTSEIWSMHTDCSQQRSGGHSYVRLGWCSHDQRVE